ncbi:MAG: diguanylate cyclase [Eubacteriales bacterium]
MNKNKNSISADLSFVFMLVLAFACVVFSAMDSNHLMVNVIAMSVVVVLMIITYFSTMLAGLVVDIIILFACFSYAVYLSYTKGYVIEPYVYFWSAMLPLSTVAVGLFAGKINILEKESIRQQLTLEESVTVDEQTGLKNQKAFLQDADVYIHIATRYKFKLICLVAGFKYPREVKSIVGNKNMENFSRKVSSSMVEILRGEDQVYMIDKKNDIWGILLISNQSDSTSSIVDRIMGKIMEIEFSRTGKNQKVGLQLRFGVSVYSADMGTPVELLSRARKEMEYDV